jgi:hypothetical protein
MNLIDDNKGEGPILIGSHFANAAVAQHSKRPGADRPSARPATPAWLPLPAD